MGARRDAGLPPGSQGRRAGGAGRRWPTGTRRAGPATARPARDPPGTSTCCCSSGSHRERVRTVNGRRDGEAETGRGPRDDQTPPCRAQGAPTRIGPRRSRIRPAVLVQMKSFGCSFGWEVGEDRRLELDGGVGARGGTGSRPPARASRPLHGRHPHGPASNRGRQASRARTTRNLVRIAPHGAPMRRAAGHSSATRIRSRGRAGGAGPPSSAPGDHAAGRASPATTPPGTRARKRAPRWLRARWESEPCADGEINSPGVPSVPCGPHPTHRPLAGRRRLFDERADGPLGERRDG